MKYICILFLAMIVLMVSSCKKDQVDESYMRGGISLLSSDDGNLIIAGFNSGGIGGYDGNILKVNTSGDILWSDNYGSSYTDGLNKVVKTNDGGYAAAGMTSLSSDYQSNLAILKINAQGGQEWLKYFGGDSTSQAYGLTTSSDNGFVACGYIQNSSDVDRDIYLVKVNSTGDKVWEKRFGKNKTTTLAGVFDLAKSIISFGDSVYYMTGLVNGNSACCGQAFLMKLNSNGDSLWMKTYSHTQGICLIATSDGNLALAGVDDDNSQDIFILKLNLNGGVIWEAKLGSAGYDYASTLIQTLDGGYALCGISSSSGSSNQEILLCRFDGFGKLVWSKTYGGDNVDQGYGLVQYSDGGYSVAGMSNSGGSYIFLNRTDSTGLVTWEKKLH
jgi:hypothetical protein